MELTGIGPSRKPGHRVEFAKEFADHLTGIFALAQLLELLHDAREGLFSLHDGDFGVVLSLALETCVVLAKLFAVEVGETLTG